MADHAFSPVYRQVTEILRGLVLDGEYRPGERIESDRALAERFGVARLTMRKAIKELVDQGVLVRGRGKQGTSVSPDPPILHPQEPAESANLGLCFLDLYRSTHPYFSRLTKALTDYCDRAGVPFTVCVVHASDIFYRRDVPVVRAIREGSVRGLLLAGRMSIEDIYALRILRVPHVWINHELASESIPATLADYADGAFSAVSHLLELGHRRIALLLGTPRNRASYLSAAGYRLGLRSGGIEFEPRLVVQGSFVEESGYQMAREVLSHEPRPTALFAADDLIACGAMKAAHELDLRIPEDISIVGYGNLVSPYATAPSLTTLEIHLEEMAVAAAELLENICSGHTIEDAQRVFRPDLIVRESTGPARNTS